MKCADQIKNSDLKISLVILSDKQKQFYREQIIEMMTLCDNDFVPPLSSRNSTLQQNLKDSTSNKNGIANYYEQMAQQHILAAFEDENLLGFVSFREDFTNEIISQNETPNIYISTLILSPLARGKGLTYKMYDYLFNELYSDRKVFTRTWGTNIAHTKILTKFGFSELFRKQNDRGIGIDTVYYKK